MAEQPTSKPTEVVNWATAGTRVEPTSGEKSTGFALFDTIPYQKMNWWRWAQGLHLDWARDRALRCFDGLPEAIAATVEGDLFRLTDDHSGFFDTPLEKTSKGGTGVAIEKIATDGEQLYYTQNNLLVAATANPTAAVEELWNVDISAMGTLSDISADGGAVALVGSNGAGADSRKVVSRDGTVLFTDNTYSLDRVFIDTRDNVYVYCKSAAGNDIYVWDSGSGVLSVFGTTAGLDTIVVTPEYVIAPGFGTPTSTFRIFDKSGVVISNTGTGPAFDPSSGVSDGLRSFFVASPGVVCYQTAIADDSSPIWTRTIPSAVLSATKIAVDGRHVYCASADAIYAIDKLLGGIVYQWDISGAASPTAIACDGRYIWTNVKQGSANPNHLLAMPIQRQGGIWRRCGDGSTVTSRAKPLPLSTLAVPMDYL